VVVENASSNPQRNRNRVADYQRVDATQWVVKVFGSYQYFRLWLVQLVGSLGDWLGFLAIAAAATELGGGTPETAVGFVFSARIIPGLFLAPLAGVLVDRWNRKRVMILCDLGRVAILLMLPFATTVWHLVIASLALEVFTLLWIPAKDSVVPSMVPKESLTTVNSLQMAATYGTVPIAASLFIFLGKFADKVETWPGAGSINADQIGLGFYADSLTFLFSAVMIYFISIPNRNSTEIKDKKKPKLDLKSTIDELREGWEFIFVNPVVRAVCAALGAGLIGGGMLIPLGPIFAKDVLGENPADGMSVLQTALGIGVAIGVAFIALSRQRISQVRLFVISVFGAGVSLFIGTSMSGLWPAASLIGLLGVFAGAIYVLGFTLLQISVAENLRGRIFSAVYTIVRLSLIIAMSIGPFVAATFNGLSEEFLDKKATIFGWQIFVPGVRVTLWLASLIIIGAGFLALTSVRNLFNENIENQTEETPKSGS
jgi:dTMP kinase|tara:strand:- start:56236 stop:57690 length:1455 start_codon:yes stop_codon:yes gene_type:complete